MCKYQWLNKINIYEFHKPMFMNRLLHYTVSRNKGYQHIYSNVVNLPCVHDPSFEENVLQFLKSLDSKYYYILFFYTYIKCHNVDSYKNGCSFISTGNFLCLHIKQPNSLDEKNVCGLIKSNFCKEFNKCVDEDCLFEVEEKWIDENEIIFVKVFNLGDNLKLFKNISINTDSDFEFTNSSNNFKIYNNDYSEPIKVSGRKTKLKLHPGIVLIYITDGIKVIE